MLKLEESSAPFIASKLAGGPLMALQLHQHACESADTLLQHPTLCSPDLELRFTQDGSNLHSPSRLRPCGLLRTDVSFLFEIQFEIKIAALLETSCLWSHFQFSQLCALFDLQMCSIKTI